MLDALDGTSRPTQGTDPSRSAGVRPLGRALPAGGLDQGKSAREARAGVQDSVHLSPEATALVAKLKARDLEVRAHEAAHLGAGGGVTKGGASFSYQHGPDGQSYAVGGEVQVDTSPVADNPQATVAKADAIRAAALAPADPSAQDLAVAAAAATMAASAASEWARVGSAASVPQPKGQGPAGSADGLQPVVALAGAGHEKGVPALVRPGTPIDITA